MPSACQNGARTENTEHEPGTRQTRTDQVNRSWLPTMRQPEKRTVGTAGGEGWRVASITRRRRAPGRRAPGEPSTRGLAPPCPACMAPVAPLFHPLPSYADAAGSSLHQRGEPHTRIRAISGPLASVHSGQLQPSASNEPPSSAHLAAMINTPSKLVLGLEGVPAACPIEQPSEVSHDYSRTGRQPR